MEHHANALGNEAIESLHDAVLLGSVVNCEFADSTCIREVFAEGHG